MRNGTVLTGRRWSPNRREIPVQMEYQSLRRPAASRFTCRMIYFQEFVLDWLVPRTESRFHSLGSGLSLRVLVITAPHSQRERI